ncbi:MAG: glycosyltransferase [Candidatus Omnitrophica bacterium]|nr:glycosyltransferase [Candidatus Omnitrophota bacterium]
MKILIVSLQFEKTSTGGGGVHVEHITDQFLELGHEVTIISIHTDKTLPEADLRTDRKTPYSITERGRLTVIRFLIEKGIAHPYVHEAKDEELRRIMKFAEVVVDWIGRHGEDFDVINLQGHHIIPGYMARQLRGKGPAKISYLHALETTYVTEKGEFVGAYDGTKEVLARIRRWESMCRYADLVIANSPMVRDDFKRIVSEFDEVSKYEERITVLASGCNKDFLMEDELIRRKLGRSPETVELVTFCRVDPSKGVEYSIKGSVEAARLSVGRKFRLTVAGIPSSEAYIEKLRTLAEGVPANLEVSFELKDTISPLEEKKQILDSKHIYILPTLKEPFGMSLIEASARGNMVVSADTNGPMYMFDAEKGEETDWGTVTDCGVLARITREPEVNLAGNIGKAVIWTVGNWPESLERVINFNSKIRANWTWEGIARRYVELFKEQQVH